MSLPPYFLERAIALRPFKVMDDMVTQQGKRAPALNTCRPCRPGSSLIDGLMHPRYLLMPISTVYIWATTADHHFIVRAAVDPHQETPVITIEIGAWYGAWY